MQQQRLRESRQPKQQSLVEQSPQAWQQPGTHAEAPQAAALAHRAVSADVGAHQLVSDVHSPLAVQAPEDSFETAAAPRDCKTPYHSMLPAPGANMLSQAACGIHMSAYSSAGPHSGQEDPIVVTVGQSKQQADKAMPARRKPGSKTWNILNLQQAPRAAQPPLLAHVSCTSPSAASPQTSMQQQQHVTHARHDATSLPVHASNDQHCEQLQQKHQGNTQISRDCLVASTAASPQQCSPVSCSPHAHQHASQPVQAVSSGAQLCEAAVVQPHLTADRAQPPLEGSETQPDLQGVQAACPTASFGTPLAAAQRASGTSSDAKFQTGAHLSQAALLNEAAPSPVCENIPDSSGNPFGVSQAHLQRLSQHELASTSEESGRFAMRRSQDGQDWHVQLKGPVIALVACGRYISRLPILSSKAKKKAKVSSLFHASLHSSMLLLDG